MLPSPDLEVGNDVIEPGRELLALVVALGQRCPELSDEQLRVGLVELGAVAAPARGLDGDPR